MYKGLAFLYVVCFLLYIAYSREPDWMDGEIMPATIENRWDSVHKTWAPFAVYEVDKKNYAIDARYLFRNPKVGKRVEVIYNAQKPAQAQVYAWWGYLITWGELLVSIGLFVALYQVAVSVTKNPTPEALLEQMEYKPQPKTKYD